jgi:hypothetical protein
MPEIVDSSTDLGAPFATLSDAQSDHRPRLDVQAQPHDAGSPGDPCELDGSCQHPSPCAPGPCGLDGGCCDGRGTCPDEGDPRVLGGTPYVPYVLHGAAFFLGQARAYHWHVEGGPCDQLLFETSGHVSYALHGTRRTSEDVTGEVLRFTPILSGDYRVTLTVSPDSGPDFVCSFVVHVRAPGLRVELCWDRTGDTDLDLWLHRPNSTTPWGDAADDDTCAYYNCRNTRSARSGVPLDWGYASTPGGACLETTDSGDCNNPRLDIDNVNSAGVPENINLDDPVDGDRFRIAVNYYAGVGPVQPLVNVYCGGRLRATLGGAHVGATTFGSQPISGFDTAGDDSHGSLWRVADVQMHEPGDDCDVLPLAVPDAGSVACVTNGPDRTFDGVCAAAP